MAVVAVILALVGFVLVYFCVIRAFGQRSRSGPLVAGALAVAFVGLAIYHSGGLLPGDPRLVSGLARAASQADATRCGKLVDTLTEAGALTGSPASGRVAVDAAAWDQIPTQARGAIRECLQRVAGPGRKVSIAVKPDGAK